MAGTSPQTNQPGQNAYQPPGSIELNPLLNSSPVVQNPSSQIPVDQNVGSSPPSTSVSPLSSTSSSNASGLHQTASNSPPSTAQNSRQQSPSQTNGNTTGSPTVTPSPSPPAAINQPSNRSLPRKILTPIWELKSPICAAIVLIITSIMIFTSNSVTGPLATIGVTSSFLVLNVLSQANNYAFVAALDKAWEALQWGPLLSGGGYLTNFLAVSASTGLGGWFRVLFHRGYSGGGRPRTWSAGRIMLALLSQFPGIIFLTLVELETSYKPTHWTPISGGIGRFNTTLATSKARNGILMSGLVLNMFRDATIVKEVPAISESCLRSNSCISYIIPGGTVTIAPWPWSFNHTVDSSLSAYMTKDTPVYQLDFWTAPSKGITWATDDCRFYGESSGAFQLCVSPQKGDQIVAGWKPCVGTLDSSGTCRGNYTAWELTPMWATFIAIYRRKVTIATDRRSNTILGISDFGNPETQNITAADFSTAFNSMLYTWKNDSIRLPCDLSGQDWQLTEWVFSSLLFNAAVSPFVAAPLESIRNLFMAPLYLYNPLTFGTDNNVSIDSPQKFLPQENYISGSYAKPVTHLVIKQWTSITYVVVDVFLLILVIATLAYGLRHHKQKNSHFPPIDFLTLSTIPPVPADQPQGSQDGMATSFAGCEAGDNGAILREADKIKIWARKRN